MMTQKRLRQEKRKQRQNLSKETRSHSSEIIVKKLLETDAYQNASRVGAYLALPEEVDVQKVIESAWKDGKTVYLPVVLGWGRALKFVPYSPDSQLVRDVLNIPIPDVGCERYIDASELDIVTTPLVAFDEQCNRIGMGGGFYDRTFAFKAQQQTSPVLIGVAFEVQKVDKPIPVNTWDICPNHIITEKKTY